MGIPVRLNNVVGCYTHLFTPHEYPGSDNLKYSIECIMDPATPDGQDNLRKLEEAYVTVLKGAGKGELVNVMPRPYKKGEEVNALRPAKGKPPRPELEGKWMIRASSRTRVAVVDRAKVPIEENQSHQIFGGCIFNVHVDLYYGTKGDPGVWCGLNGVQLVTNVGVQPIGSVRPEVDEMFETLASDPTASGSPAAATPSEVFAPQTPPPWA